MSKGHKQSQTLLIMYLTAEPSTYANPVTTPSANPVQFETAYRSGNMYGYIRSVAGYTLSDGTQEQGHVEATYGYKCQGLDLLATGTTYTDEVAQDMTEAQFLAWLDSNKY